jgi:hypothetical protein
LRASTISFSKAAQGGFLFIFPKFSEKKLLFKSSTGLAKRPAFEE